jgi:DNA-binding transcriptional LysR family regulator
MELRQLAYLVAVAEEQSFTRAAARELVAQPGVSAQIRRLEAELGQPLFDRGGGSITLTPAGAAALPFARAAVASAAGVRNAVEEVTGLVRGRVALGVMPSTATFFADPLATFARQHGGVEITLREDTSAALLSALAGGGLDVVLAVLSGPLPAGLTSQTVTDEPLVAYMAPAHPLSRRQSLSLNDLREEPMIVLPRGTGARSALDQGCAAVGLSLRIAFEAGDPLVLAALAARGLGVAVLPRSNFEGVKPVALTGPMLRSRMELAWREDGPTGPAARALLTHLRTTLAS